MWLLDRLRALLSLGDRSSTDAADGSRATERRCAICGTPVDSDADECPLCRSTDLVSPDETPDRPDGSPGSDPFGEGPAASGKRPSSADGSDPASRQPPEGGDEESGDVHSRPGDATESAAERLNDLRETRDGVGESDGNADAPAPDSNSDTETD